MFQCWKWWNWKSAAFSACVRAALFAAGAAGARPPAVLKSVLVELSITMAVGGLQGALTQRLRDSEPAWRAMLICSAAVALLNHPAEYLLHNLAQTPGTAPGIVLSLAYTVIATRFSFYVMRRGLFLTGGQGNSFLDDLRQLPSLIGRGTDPHPGITDRADV